MHPLALSASACGACDCLTVRMFSAGISRGTEENKSAIFLQAVPVKYVLVH